MDDSTREFLLNLARRLERAHSESAVWIAKDVARQIKKFSAPIAPSSSLLSSREKEILQHVANGFSNPEIATALEISVKTVQFHLKSIFTKTGTSGRAEAVSTAFKEKLLP